MIFLERELTERKIPHRKNCPLASFSTFRIGGSADLAVFPNTPEELVFAARACRRENLPVFVVGGGSNILLSDAGLRGAVIFTKGLKNVTDEPDGFFAACGVLLPGLSNRAAAHGLAGLEFAAGIPGTVGGAVCMNAGAHGGEMAQVVAQTDYYDLKTDTCGSFFAAEHAFGYRKSVYSASPEKIVLGARIKLKQGNQNAIQEKIKQNLAFRRKAQPLGQPSAGSAFKRPTTGSAAELIDRCGLKGFSIGGAAVSEKHAGFIVNRGNATAKDVLELMNLIRKTVYEKTGVLLEPEIRVFG